MARGDWYRNKVWNAQIEATFQEKLSRARSQKPQYLLIQASILGKKYPRPALGLIDQYFALDDELWTSRAFEVQAMACLSLNRRSDALSAYRRALDWELEHPSIQTGSWYRYCELVASNRIDEEYDYALSVLGREEISPGGPFPDGRYVWNGANAIIADDLGLFEEAKEFAERALRAAAERQSPFSRHRKLGLVQTIDDKFGRQIQTIASHDDLPAEAPVMPEPRPSGVLGWLRRHFAR